MTSRYRRDALSIAHLTGWELRPTSEDQLSASFFERCRSSSPGFLGQFRGFGSHHCSWGYIRVSAVEGDNPAAVGRVWLVLSSPAYPREPCLRRGFSCPGFPSPVGRQELCRYTRGLRVVAVLS